jgi:hypothetical protein
VEIHVISVDHSLAVELGVEAEDSVQQFLAFLALLLLLHLLAKFPHLLRELLHLSAQLLSLLVLALPVHLLGGEFFALLGQFPLLLREFVGEVEDAVLAVEDLLLLVLDQLFNGLFAQQTGLLHVSQLLVQRGLESLMLMGGLFEGRGQQFHTSFEAVSLKL